MAIIELNLKPNPRELRWFGLLLWLFFGVAGGLVTWRTGSLVVSGPLWIAGSVIAAIFYLVPPLRLAIYAGWMVLVYPIGWTFSHILFAFIYYLVVTPIGGVLRLFGRQLIDRHFDPDASTYWIDRPPPNSAPRYFRQF